MKSALASILCACLIFNTEAQSRREGLSTNANCHNCSQITNTNNPVEKTLCLCVETITDGTNTAFKVALPDPEPEARAWVGFTVGYFLCITATRPEGAPETFSTPLLDPLPDTPAPGMITLFCVETRAYPSGTRFSVCLYDRDGNYLGVF